MAPLWCGVDAFLGGMLMLKMKFGHGDWIVVCDGAKALILENDGDEMFPNLRTREVREEKHAPTREQGTERPGRVHEATNASRSAVEQTDWKGLAEEAFLQDLAKSLDAEIATHKVKKVHIVAAPKALGVLRQAYGGALKAALGQEVPKDFVSMPVHEIERQLTGDAPGTS